MPEKANNTKACSAKTFHYESKRIGRYEFELKFDVLISFRTVLPIVICICTFAISMTF